MFNGLCIILTMYNNEILKSGREIGEAISASVKWKKLESNTCENPNDNRKSYHRS